jgi:hypothetical protein
MFACKQPRAKTSMRASQAGKNSSYTISQLVVMSHTLYDCYAISLSACITMLQVHLHVIHAAPTVISNFFHITVKRVVIWN